MNKLLLGLITIFSFLLPTLNLRAIELSGSSVFEDNKSYTIELKALPKTGENAVKLNIVITGAQIEDYFLYNETDWLSIIPECSNGKRFSNNSICLTLIKSEELSKTDSLGFLTIKITDISNLSIYKINGTEYSDGVNIREDLGELVSDSYKVQTSKELANSPIYGSQDPIVFYLIIGLLFGIIIILGGLVITFLRPNKTTTLNI